MLFRKEGDKLKEVQRKHVHKAEDKEKVIQDLIAGNLERIFGRYVFLESEFKVGEGRIDTVAFDEERSTFALIEYKNVRHEGVIEQGLSYYDLLQERREDFVRLYRKKRGGQLRCDGVSWEEARVILVAPEFTSRQKRASRHISAQIDLYEVSAYDDGMVIIDRVTDERHPKAAEYSEEDHLSGRIGAEPGEATKGLYQKLRDGILGRVGVEIRCTKSYVGFYTKDTNTLVCAIRVKANSLELEYTTKDGSIFPKDGGFVGKRPDGKHRSDIKNAGDVDKALPLVEKTYQKK